jgi:predicted dienelactone hydrolase
MGSTVDGFKFTAEMLASHGLPATTLMYNAPGRKRRRSKKGVTKKTRKGRGKKRSAK